MLLTLFAFTCAALRHEHATNHVLSARETNTVFPGSKVSYTVNGVPQIMSDAAYRNGQPGKDVVREQKFMIDKMNWGSNVLKAADIKNKGDKEKTRILQGMVKTTLIGVAGAHFSQNLAGANTQAKKILSYSTRTVLGGMDFLTLFTKVTQIGPPGGMVTPAHSTHFSDTPIQVSFSTDGTATITWNSFFEYSRRIAGRITKLGMWKVKGKVRVPVGASPARYEATLEYCPAPPQVGPGMLSGLKKRYHGTDGSERNVWCFE